MKCNVCGNAADLELNLNTQDDDTPVWYPICFDCEEKYRTIYGDDTSIYQEYGKEF
jgi:hypothetical protein